MHKQNVLLKLWTNSMVRERLKMKKKSAFLYHVGKDHDLLIERLKNHVRFDKMILAFTTRI